MNRLALILALPLVGSSLVACGSEAPGAARSEDSQVAQGNDALETTSVALTDTRRQDLVASYQEIDASAFDAEHQVAALAPDIAIAVVDVTAAIKSARISQQREIWVPAGTVAAPRDPNVARRFYVVFHSSDASTIYGPFDVHGREGAACGGYIGGALPSCLSGLVCVGSDAPDKSGTCAKAD